MRNTESLMQSFSNQLSKSFIVALVFLCCACSTIAQPIPPKESSLEFDFPGIYAALGHTDNKERFVVRYHILYDAMLPYDALYEGPARDSGFPWLWKIPPNRALNEFASGISLKMLWPSLERQSKSNLSEFSRLGWGNKVYVSLNVLSSKTDSREAFLSRVGGRYTLPQLPMARSELQAMKVIASRYGLGLPPEYSQVKIVDEQEILSNASLGPAIRIFEWKDGEALKGYISCQAGGVYGPKLLKPDPEDWVINTGCSLLTWMPEVHGFLKINFAMLLLKDWHQIHDRVRSLLLGMQIKQ